MSWPSPYHHRDLYQQQQPPPIPPRPAGFYNNTEGLGYQHQHQQHLPPPPPPPVQQQQPPLPHLIWQPPVGTTWNYVLRHPLRLDVDPSALANHHVYILDLFDTPPATIQSLHQRGHRVVAYFSAGTREAWRADAAQFPKADVGRPMDDWPGEAWVRTGSPAVRAVMRARLDLARHKGFDGVDPDNVDAYDNKNGLKLTKDDAVDYVRFLAREAHARGLAVGLKNAGDIVPRVVGEVEWCVQEQCVQYGDEEQFVPFIKAGKPVFHVEYPKGDDADNDKHNNDREVTGKKRDKCFRARELGFSTIIKNVRLDQWIQTN